jgi:hypothetical protein
MGRIKFTEEGDMVASVQLGEAGGKRWLSPDSSDCGLNVHIARVTEVDGGVADRVRDKCGSPIGVLEASRGRSGEMRRSEDTVGDLGMARGRRGDGVVGVWRGDGEPLRLLLGTSRERGREVRGRGDTDRFAGERIGNISGDSSLRDCKGCDCGDL